MRINVLFRKLLTYLNLESELDNFDRIHASIERDIVFKGTNLWILVFAILVASVGLNVNSTAVIIGAMLISPLMGPINGAGYSIATYNFPLFRRALKNLAFAVGASLVASTSYFLISPLSTAHSELLARTSPTIYDVLIAFFGGFAGIVASSSSNKGNVIPGVAIATALMPPLCTAGYGLATAQFTYFFGAFYLFSINAVFIALASLIMSQVLKFPIRTVVDSSQRKRINTWISVVLVAMVAPSIYFGYKLVQQERFNENATRYLASVSIVDGNFLLRSDVEPGKRIINLVYGGQVMTEEQRERIRLQAEQFDLSGATIEFKQGLAIESSANTEVDRLKTELSTLGQKLDQRENELDEIFNKRRMGDQILKELRALYPEIERCSVAGTYEYQTEKQDADTIMVVLLSAPRNALGKVNQKQVNAWLKTRLSNENLRVFYSEVEASD